MIASNLLKDHREKPETRNENKSKESQGKNAKARNKPTNLQKKERKTMQAAAAGRPLLPAPTSWYPGHMTQFTRMLPALLRRTDVVLELRDSRLPLTSINPNFEGALCCIHICSQLFFFNSVVFYLFISVAVFFLHFVRNAFCAVLRRQACFISPLVSAYMLVA